MNKELFELYNKKWNNLLERSKGMNATHPLLIKVNDEYQESNIKVMIVGQETDDWGGKLEGTERDIYSLQNSYFDYLYKSKKKNRRPFWNRKNFKYYEEELRKAFSTQSVTFIWNNVSKIGNYGKNKGQATKNIKALEKEYFDVFEEELIILKPDIVIFTIGNRNIPVEHDKLDSLKSQPVSIVNLKKYPKIIALRTYHPNARIEGGKKDLMREVVGSILEMYMDYHDLKVADKRLSDSNDKNIKADDFFKELGL